MPDKIAQRLTQREPMTREERAAKAAAIHEQAMAAERERLSQTAAKLRAQRAARLAQAAGNVRPPSGDETDQPGS